MGVEEDGMMSREQVPPPASDGVPDGMAGEDQGLLSNVARDLTSLLLGGRSMTGRLISGAGSQARTLLGELRDVGDDVVRYLEPGPWLEEIYAAIGIASTGALSELDERIDEVELKADEAARRRAREELLLLQERIAALEDLLEQRGAVAADAAVTKLLDRLADLEAQIDALPWPAPGEEARPGA